MNPNIDKTALFKLSYGLFVLTACDGEKDNGCIINTVIQAAENPTRLVFAVNKSGLTHDMVLKTRKFNVSVISEKSKMDVFRHFGFASGREVNKFNTPVFSAKRSENEVYYLSDGFNAYFSGFVTDTVDLGTHTLFIATVVKAQVLDSAKSMTYTYYFENVKPAPTQESKGWICKICGYVYEGEELPDDFVCPICKHTASDFEKI